MLQDGSSDGPARGPYLPEGTDVVFPVLHGPGGEDGSVQGWLKLLDIPCVGSGCTGSAVAMDKSVAKHILRSANIPVLLWTDVVARDWVASREVVLERIEGERGYPCFVKPARLGSSLGIARVEDREALAAALDGAFAYGEYVLVEPALDCRELEVAVLDGTPEVVSLPGEIVTDGWYDYDSKYRDESAELHAPTGNLEPRMAEALRDLALRAFRVLRLSGFARVDFLLDRKAGRYYLNEVNSIPGFTSISMFPKLMAAADVPFDRLCDRLIELALQECRVADRDVSAPPLEREGGAEEQG
jgi:D-alanine-D-alanine ligase